MNTTVKKEKEKSVSKLVWCAKSISVLSVIIAHSVFSGIQNDWTLMLINRIGAMGVPVFLMLSAYYYKPKKYGSVWELLKSKKALFFPWIFLGSACYLWSDLRMGKAIGVLKLLQFLLGYNSFLYFMLVLILLQIVFYIFRFINIKVLTIVCIVISIISIELSAFGITDMAISSIGLTNYLNVFNWIGFYAIGLYLQTKPDDELIDLLKRYSVWSIFLWVILFFAGYYFEPTKYGYFSVLGPFMEFASAIVVLRIAWIICHCNWIVKLGKYSFAIYLIHINVVPVVYKFLGGSIIGELISPLCTYLITFVLIKITCTVLKRIKMERAAKYLLGVRIE